MKYTIDYKLDNWNDTIAKCRNNKYGANISKKKEMGIVKMFLLNGQKVKKYPVEIHCKWHIKNSNSDLDNKSLKSVLDEMQEIGILENDNIKHINKITYEAIKDNKDYLEIEIKEK